MTVYHATTLDLLTDELERHRRQQTDAAATAERWRQEMPSMGLSIDGMAKRSAEAAAVVGDLESLIAIAQGANEAEAECFSAKSGAGR